MNSETYRPSWWYRLLGIANWSAQLREDGILLNGTTIPWEQVTNCVVDRKCLGTDVSILSPDRHLLKGASVAFSESLGALCSYAKPIRSASRKIDRFLASTYFASEFDRLTLLQFIERDISWQDKRKPLPALRRVPPLLDAYKRVLLYLDGDRHEIDERNTAFVDHELHNWSEWFARVEKTPLTDEQARAAVIMEDRNLLIAAAGSGKTSTIVAKAAYAIAKGYCQPNELLVLTFNTKIREELEERLTARLSSAGLPTAITVETFNAFGLGQVRRINKAVRLAPWATESAAELAHVCAISDSLVKTNPDFAVALAEFSAVWLESDEKEESEILVITETGTIEKALQLLKTRAAPQGAVPTYTTLAGNTVRSLQELRISNWLTLMGINYEYERTFDPALTPPDWKNGYRPDFYYPEIDCWHEHFGLNKLGKAPPWMSATRNGRQRTYEDEVENKRELLTRCGKQWFETTSADFDRGHWDTVLRKELSRRGLTPQFIGWETFAREFKAIETVTKQVISLIVSCIHHAKSNRLTPSAVRAQLSQDQRPRARAFLQVFLPVYEAYEQSLKDRGEVDFEDMVIQSADAFSDGRLQHPYRIILVDEFQDVSNSRAGLLSALLSQSPDIRLFGVGDDWQSIYRFAGADITAMTEFEGRFGFSAISHLTKTFRSSQYIADVASQFIMKNPSQLKKKVRATSRGDETAIEAVFYSNGHTDDVLENELSALAEQHRQASQKITVFLLGRYNLLKPERLGTWKALHGDILDISFMTIHRSKGLEADVVIVLNATNKKGRDFPSTIQDDPLLTLFMPTADKMAWAEERRLFYVALTRARSKVCILVPEGKASTFVTELLASHQFLRSMHNGKGKTAIHDARPYVRLPACPKCGRGSVMQRVSEFGPFEFCNLNCGYKRNLKTAPNNSPSRAEQRT